MLFMQPDLVSLEMAGEGRTIPFRVRALREGWAWAPRDWRRATVDTGAGDPRGATREKGERYFRAVTERIACYLQELADTPTQRLYEGE